LVQFRPKNARNNPKKTVFTLILRRFLTKNTHFRPKNAKKMMFFACFLPIFDGKMQIFIAFRLHFGTD